jgi:hypothetical protein
VDINTAHCIYWTLTQNTVYQDIQCYLLMSSIYNVLCWCPVYTVFCVNVQYIQCCVNVQYIVFCVHEHRTLYILDISTEHYILDINTEHFIYWTYCTLMLNTVYTEHQYRTYVNVVYIQCFVLMSSIYSVLCLCPVYTVYSVNVQYIQCFLLIWTLTQNTVYTGY